MGQTTTLIRTSIFAFLQHLHLFSSSPSLLALPFAAATLLCQPLLSSSPLFPSLHHRLKSLFLAAGFPPSSDLFPVLNLKLTQTLLSFLFLLPFSLSFLLLSKASTIQTLFPHHNNKNNNFLSWISTLNALVVTQFCNSLVILSANATCFSLLIIFFDISDILGVSSPKTLLLLSAIGAIAYSIVVANACIICNLALIISGVENRGGFASILKSCVLLKGRMGIALSLAVPINMGLAGIEALFQYRIVRAYNRTMDIDLSMALEAMLVAYMYAMLVVLDTVVGSVFLKSCRADYDIDRIDERSDQGSVFGKEKAFESLL
ncbi:hypothetical protein CASFOL_018398 [Castilleja foliolosa]|uniref:Uncharacterized protein n=1 Tax=Castilleja foliolosa TaxID=1961234 RepID=A0ABD3D6L2_9LAMI